MEYLLGMKQTSCATCFLCEASCGLLVDHDAGRVTAIRGDKDDKFSRGHICPKGVAMMDVQHDPDRLRTPMRKTASGWRPIDWDEALNEIATRVAETQERHGNDAVGLYTGNPTIHNYGGVLFGQLLAKAVSTRNMFSATSVDGLPRVLTSLLMYGSQAVLPIADIEHTQHMLIIGANPAVSNGSIMTAPDCKKRLQEVIGRGGKVVVLDPRRSETARLASEHHFVRPGTDALLLLAMLDTIFSEGLAKPGRLRQLVDGWDQVEQVVRGVDAATVAPVVGIDAGTIVRMAREFANAPSAVAYGRMGVCTQRFGAVTSWLIDVLNIVTGNLDSVGGAMFPKGAVDLPGIAAKIGQNGSFDRYRSRVSGLPEFNGEFPVAAFAEELETPGQGQVRMLITNAGNPALSLPNGRRLEAAFAKLDFMVSIDIYLNETTKHADIILPPTWGLENDYYPLIFGSLAIRNHAKYSQAVLPRDGDTRPDWQIFIDLATRIKTKRSKGLAIGARLTDAIARRVKPRGVLDIALRTGPYRGLSVRKLERNPHGIDLGPLQPRLKDVVRTESGRVQLAPRLLVDDVTRVRQLLTQSSDDALILIGRRTLRSNNSWMHNSERLVKGNDRCVLLMHPDDAEKRGLKTGDRARIATSIGAIEAPVAISDEIMRGIISLPHGWGHDRDGVRLRVASKRPGVSVNDITDDSAIDPVSGVTHFNGIPTRVERIQDEALLRPTQLVHRESAGSPG